MKKIKRTITYLLTVALLVTGFAGCGEQRELKEEKSKREKPVVTEAPVATEVPEATEAPTVSKEPVSSGMERTDFEVEHNYLEYTLSEEGIAECETQLLLCEQMLQDGVPYSEMEIAVDILDELTCGIQYQASIAEVLYYCDMQDEEAEENYLFSKQVSTEITSECLRFLVELYDGGEYDRYFDEWSEVEMKYLESYSEENAEIEFRNAEIMTEFYALQEDEFEEKIGVLYSEFINNCEEIAAKSGYTNYYEYASALSYKRDYGSEEREQFRKYVKEYIVPLYYSSYEQHEKSYTELSRGDKRFIGELLYNPYDSLETDYVNAYFETLPESAKAGMLHMFEEEAYVRADNENALEGAFTVGIGVPFCYFGPGYENAFTIIHEIGHYYADYNVNTSLLSYDLCETQSQGNEMLFLTYLETVLDQEVFEALEDYRLYYFIDTIVVATLMDEFEETIYQLPDQVEFTAEEFDEIMEQIIQSYGFDDDDEYIRVNMEWIWRNVGISYPVYYLNYATSAMASLNLYAMSQEDYHAALEAYRIIQEEVDMDRDFTGTLEKAGMDSVFEEEAYIKLQGLFEER